MPTDSRDNAAALAPAVVTRALTRTFRSGKRWSPERVRETVALAGVDVEIARGEFFGVLGPNGAGKTTLMKILTTLLAPTSGDARVAGFDVAQRPREVRRRITLVSGGDNAGYGILTVRETLWMFSQFYGVPTRESRVRGDWLMQRLGLEEKADERVNRLSTGFKQRLNFARGFISEPEIVFLDEPTLGLDVSSARRIREFLREWMKERPGRTTLLTTHYMAEADELCDRIAIIDGGRILATDTPNGLRARVSAARRVVLEVEPEDALTARLSALPGVEHLRTSPPTDRGTVAVHLRLADPRAMRAVMDHLGESGRTVHNLSTHDPSLEDVFVEIVGREMDDAGNVVDASAAS